MITERFGTRVCGMCFLKFDSEESKNKLRPSAAMRVKTAKRWGLGRERNGASENLCSPVSFVPLALHR
jgi:hypothetical protein